jgi:hypothetical protein
MHIVDHDHFESIQTHWNRSIDVEPNLSCLNKSSSKRAVRYDIESIDDIDHIQPLRSYGIIDEPSQQILRRRFIAHWGLPGKQFERYSNNLIIVCSCRYRVNEYRMAR